MVPNVVISSAKGTLWFAMVSLIYEAFPGSCNAATSMMEAVTASCMTQHFLSEPDVHDKSRLLTSREPLSQYSSMSQVSRAASRFSLVCSGSSWPHNESTKSMLPMSTSCNTDREAFCRTRHDVTHTARLAPVYCCGTALLATWLLYHYQLTFGQVLHHCLLLKDCLEGQRCRGGGRGHAGSQLYTLAACRQQDIIVHCS